MKSMVPRGRNQPPSTNGALWRKEKGQLSLPLFLLLA